MKASVSVKHTHKPTSTHHVMTNMEHLTPSYLWRNKHPVKYQILTRLTAQEHYITFSQNKNFGRYFVVQYYCRLA